LLLFKGEVLSSTLVKKLATHHLEENTKFKFKKKNIKKMRDVQRRKLQENNTNEANCRLCTKEAHTSTPHFRLENNVYLYIAEAWL
jgi:hypothetical protein